MVATFDREVPILSVDGAFWHLMAAHYAPAVSEVRASLLKVRAKLRWSRPMLAAFLGTSEATLRRWESGARQPSGAARRLIWLVKTLLLEPQKLQSGMSWMFWAKEDEIAGFMQKLNENEPQEPSEQTA